MAWRSADRPARRRIPAAVWTLGFVSLFMDVSSEMIHALLPVYLVTVLGASMLAVGAIEGIAEATANFAKVFSGALSDRLGKRKAIAALGYGLAAFSKPIFPLATSLSAIVAARFIDRVGKGIRGAPRDALVADISPPEVRGASFGLRQALDTVGAFLGPGLAILFMALFAGNFTAVFWIAVVPAFIAFGLITFGVHDPERPSRPANKRERLRMRDIGRFPPAFWWITGIACVFTLARFSEAFLLLRAQSVGVPIALIPAVLIAMNVVYSLAAYPAGALSDRTNRVTVLATGFGILVAADIVLGLAANAAAVFGGAMLWGLHMGLTQGLLAALIADTAPKDLRGTAFGLFNLLSGLVLLAASLIAGGLWDAIGPNATFLAGGMLAAVAMIGLFLARRRLPAMRVSGDS